MAKLKAPLMSLGASGQLGKALVFFPWKGLNVVREYVVPANPKSTAQGIQRTYLTEIVAKIHAAQALDASPLGAADVRAYALWASAVQAATTWFNQAVRNWLDLKVDGKDPNIFRGGYAEHTRKFSADVVVYFSEETAGKMAAGKFYLGTSKTALIKIKDAVLAGGPSFNNAAAPWTDLTLGTKYYWQFRADDGDESEGCRSGIYYFVATSD